MTEASFNQNDTLTSHHSPEKVKEMAESAVEQVKASAKNLKNQGADRETLHNLVTGVITARRGDVDWETIMSSADEGYVEDKKDTTK